MTKTCIIIPCYNEAERLPVSDFKNDYDNFPTHHFLFVNDGSSDNTLQVLQRLLDDRKDRIKVLDLAKNQGKAEAVRQGMLEALKWQKFDVIGFMDADLATPLNEIENLAPHINKDILFVFGSRVQRIGVNIDRKLHRHLLGRIFATFASNMLHMKVYDTQCGAKFFRSDVVKNIFNEKFQSNWIFDLEIFFKLSNEFQNMDINNYAREIPLNTWRDIAGSKIKLTHFLKVPFQMYKLNRYFKEKRYNNPT